MDVPAQRPRWRLPLCAHATTPRLRSARPEPRHAQCGSTGRLLDLTNRRSRNLRPRRTNASTAPTATHGHQPLEKSEGARGTTKRDHRAIPCGAPPLSLASCKSPYHTTSRGTSLTQTPNRCLTLLKPKESGTCYVAPFRRRAGEPLSDPNSDYHSRTQDRSPSNYWATSPDYRRERPKDWVSNMHTRITTCHISREAPHEHITRTQPSSHSPDPLTLQRTSSILMAGPPTVALNSAHPCHRVSFALIQIGLQAHPTALRCYTYPLSRPLFPENKGALADRKVDCK